MLITCWFGTGSCLRGYYFNGMSKLPLETIALILSMVCARVLAMISAKYSLLKVAAAIDEWSEGSLKHKSLLTTVYGPKYDEILLKLKK